MRIWRVGLPIFVLCLVFVLIPVAGAQQQTYVVQPGENLFRIALNHGLTTQELAAANGIVNPAWIYAGQVLVIPQAGSPSSNPAPAAPSAPATSSTTHLVQRGEILSRIALRYGVSVQSIAQANGIYNPSLIYYGQTLIIPAASDSTAANPAPAPAPAPAPVNPPVQSLGAKWIDVNLTTQTLTAYEGTTPVFNSLISSGTWAHPTVTGQFSIYVRYQSQDMNGYRLGYDYYLAGVPYVMYFYRDYALHGTYWHNNFGTPMSHGCVNLPTPAAQWLFNWSSYGTPVNVHY
ncbi:MAG: LysM peptidoglycan-binding domain-containing protein [Chloroflexota bacterium]|jgi:lipoprotein-anchoring transpeptidase ErfK/SrfK